MINHGTGSHIQARPTHPAAMTTPPRPFLSRFSWQDWIITAAILLLIGITFGLSFFKDQPLTATASPTPTLTNTVTPSASPSPTLPPTSTPTIAEPAITFTPGPLSQGLIVLSMMDTGFSHLFAIQPGGLPLTRLTANPWDDITPTLSPDGSRIAFSSRQNGYWDLFILDLVSGALTRLTDTADYDASPSWSPDGQWLVYETFNGNSFDISICSTVDPLQPHIRLTEDPAADYSPAWSPQGRSIAFVSDRTGQADIWLADLNRTNDRFINLSQSALSAESHPTWSPDGSRLAWSSKAEGIANLVIWDATDQKTHILAGGDWPAWSPDGAYLATLIQMPNHTYLAVFSARSGDIALPAETLPGALQGLSWSLADLPSRLPSPLDAASRLNPTPLWTTILTPTAAGPAGRQRVVPLVDVIAPRVMLHDRVDEAFQALRSRVAQELGWDFLANLENTFVTLTDPLPPALQDDWLYTGRSFTANPVPLNAGWMVLVQEAFGAETYWHVYVKTRAIKMALKAFQSTSASLMPMLATSVIPGSMIKEGISAPHPRPGIG